MHVVLNKIRCLNSPLESLAWPLVFTFQTILSLSFSFSLSLSISLSLHIHSPASLYQTCNINVIFSFLCVLLSSVSSFTYTNARFHFSTLTLWPFYLRKTLLESLTTFHYPLLYTFPCFTLFSSVLLLLGYPFIFLHFFFQFSSIPISHNSISSSNVSIFLRSGPFVAASSLFFPFGVSVCSAFHLIVKWGLEITYLIGKGGSCVNCVKRWTQTATIHQGRTEDSVRGRCHRVRNCFKLVIKCLLLLALVLFLLLNSLKCFALF